MIDTEKLISFTLFQVHPAHTKIKRELYFGCDLRACGIDWGGWDKVKDFGIYFQELARNMCYLGRHQLYYIYLQKEKEKKNAVQPVLGSVECCL
ncbi:hypothetical protein Leryth_002974 [Lithospermum erythrorhizon]|nr:hypothetical protein Leryth_002974 [Lithospermum erythrorhizon]